MPRMVKMCFPSLWFNKKIRILGVHHGDNHQTSFINDRILIDALDFLKNLTPDPLKVQLHTLKRAPIGKIDPQITVSQAARLFIDKNYTCLVYGHKIITAWHIVNKMLISQVAY